MHLFFYKLSMFGLGLRNSENDYVTGEKAFIRFLKSRKLLQSGVILDIGANVGHYSTMLRNSNVTLPIYAFEPHPLTYLKLKVIAQERNFTPVCLGAGDASSESVIYDYNGQGGSEHASMYKEVIETLHHGLAEEIRISMTTLDEFAATNKINKIALLKIDTEGHERNVLRGATNTIKAGIIDVIQLEFNEMNVISKTFFKDIIDLLPNYDFFRLLPDGPLSLGTYHPVHYEIFCFQNIVAVRKGLC
ncbi:FkbM family methyltransferase [Chitinophaga sp. Hz27]|uniref:FkbM family methyltransferase n=1 Tax=Chitinophaga sp. Hz27 TaxID=3347169 RepID=UPI0035E1F372